MSPEHQVRVPTRTSLLLRGRSPARALSAFAAALAAVGALLIASPTASADPGWCADVMILGVPGSNQTYEGAPPLRFGPEVWAVVDEAKRRNPGARRVSYEALRYPAKLDLSYFSSKNRGYDLAFAKLRTWGDQCKASKFALVGYSQGAHVAGDLTGTIVSKSQPVAPGRLLAVQLMADPAFNPSSPGTQRVGGGIGHGIAGTRTAWPKTLQMTSVCIVGDSVCDSVAPVGAAQMVVDAMLGGAHTQYAKKAWPGTSTPIAKQLGLRLANSISLAPHRY